MGQLGEIIYEGVFFNPITNSTMLPQSIYLYFNDANEKEEEYSCKNYLHLLCIIVKLRCNCN